MHNVAQMHPKQYHTWHPALTYEHEGKVEGEEIE